MWDLATIVRMNKEKAKKQKPKEEQVKKEVC